MYNFAGIFKSGVSDILKLQWRKKEKKCKIFQKIYVNTSAFLPFSIPPP
jgi:hypothetical protein